jgi:hypothetical protein
VAVSASNYLIFVLGLTDLLSAVGVYYELSRILAACCEAVYLYCMLRWVVFRDSADPVTPEPGVGIADSGEGGSDGGTGQAGDARLGAATQQTASAARAPGPTTKPESGAR